VGDIFLRQPSDGMNPAPSVAFDCRGGFADRGTASAPGCAAELSPLTRDEVSGQLPLALRAASA